MYVPRGVGVDHAAAIAGCALDVFDGPGPRVTERGPTRSLAGSFRGLGDRSDIVCQPLAADAHGRLPALFAEFAPPRLSRLLHRACRGCAPHAVEPRHPPPPFL